MAPKHTHLSLFLVTIALFSAQPSRSEYAAGGLTEAQSLPKVITDTKAPISPEVMAAVVAKVKANPQLTNALIQANPRFKRILGISDNAPAAAAAPVAPASPTAGVPVAYTLAPKNAAPSKEKDRLNLTMSQVRSILGTGSPAVELAQQATPAADDIPDTNRFGEPLAVNTPPTGRRLLGGLDPQNARRERSAETLELKRKILLQKERRFARLSNSRGGASLQASLEFNRRVRGAVGPSRGNDFQLAMRDISEAAPQDAPNSSIRRRKIIGGENRAARPVSATEETDLVAHKFLYTSALIKEGEGGDGAKAPPPIPNQAPRGLTSFDQSGNQQPRLRPN